MHTRRLHCVLPPLALSTPLRQCRTKPSWASGSSRVWQCMEHMMMTMMAMMMVMAAMMLMLAAVVMRTAMLWR